MDKLFRKLAEMVQPRLVPVFSTGTTNFPIDFFADGEGASGSEDADEEEEKEDEEPQDEEEDQLPEEYKSLTPAEMVALLEQRDKRLSEVNQESAERRRKLKEYEEAEKKRKRDSMDEEERFKADLEEAQKERDALLKEVRQLRTQQKVSGSVIESGAKKFHLIDPSDFVLPEDSDVEDIPVLLDTLFKEKPHYFVEVKPESGLSDDGSPREDERRKKGKDKNIPLPKMKL